MARKPDQPFGHEYFLRSRSSSALSDYGRIVPARSGARFMARERSGGGVQRVIVALALVIGIAAGVGFVVKGGVASAGPSASPSLAVVAEALSTPTAVPTAAPTAPAVDYAALRQRLNQPGPLVSVSVVNDVPFTTTVDCGGNSVCQIGLDIYVPAGDGPYPTIVLIGPGGRGYLSFYATALAARGYLVYNANFRDISSLGAGFPGTFEDVACAIRFARADAVERNGVATPLTLVGHSLGGWIGSVVALDQWPFRGGCLQNAGSGRPEAFVGFAGNYWISSGENSSELNLFFGGSGANTAAARTASDPFSYADGDGIPIRLVAGTADGSVDNAQSKQLYNFLAGKGWDVQLIMVPGGSHMSVLTDPAGYEAVRQAFLATLCLGPGCSSA